MEWLPCSQIFGRTEDEYAGDGRTEEMSEVLPVAGEQVRAASSDCCEKNRPIFCRDLADREVGGVFRLCGCSDQTDPFEELFESLALFGCREVASRLGDGVPGGHQFGIGEVPQAQETTVCPIGSREEDVGIQKEPVHLSGKVARLRAMRDRARVPGGRRQQPGRSPPGRPRFPGGSGSARATVAFDGHTDQEALIGCLGGDERARSDAEPLAQCQWQEERALGGDAETIGLPEARWVRWLCVRIFADGIADFLPLTVRRSSQTEYSVTAISC
jgi:hypothetical protein